MAKRNHAYKPASELSSTAFRGDHIIIHPHVDFLALAVTNSACLVFSQEKEHHVGLLSLVCINKLSKKCM